MTQDKTAEVLTFVREMNDTWTVGKQPERLADHFHERMVAVAAGVPQRIEGRAACVAGWSAYAHSRDITGWDEDDVDVRFFADGRVAVVNYYWRIRYRAGEREREDRGRDTLTLVHEGGRWWLAADHFSNG